MKVIKCKYTDVTDNQYQPHLYITDIELDYNYEENNKDLLLKVPPDRTKYITFLQGFIHALITNLKSLK